MKIAELGEFEHLRGLTRRRREYDDYEDILIRYGIPSFSSYDSRFLRVINRASAIRNNINKLKSLVVLSKNGVKTIPFWTNFNDIPRTSFPVFRRRLQHSRGNDIKILMDKTDRQVGDFYTQQITNWREYRCHIMFGQCVRLSSKQKKREEELTEEEIFHPIIRSFHRGWKVLDHFKHYKKVENEMINLCIRAMRTMGLDFGAIDVIVDENRVPHIMEVNTAPHLNELGRQMYVKEFRENLGLSNEEIDLSKIREWELFKEIPIKYRLPYSNKEERRLNEQIE